jgi:hypothetical protein
LKTSVVLVPTSSDSPIASIDVTVKRDDTVGNGAHADPRDEQRGLTAGARGRFHRNLLNGDPAMIQKFEVSANEKV